MSEPKWTPAPWVATHVDRYWHIDGDGTNCGNVATIWSHENGEEKANARLIAAAPDLYSGCSAMVGLIQLILNRADLSDDLRMAIANSHRLAEAQVALRKADGVS